MPYSTTSLCGRLLIKSYEQAVPWCAAERNDWKRNQKLGISVAEAAKRLGISMRLAYNWARRADFPAFKVGNRVVVYEKGLGERVRKMAKDTAA